MSQPTRQLSRRTLFAGAGTAGALAAAATLIPGAAKVAPAEAVAPKAPPANGGGYHLSEHVRQYYKTTLI